MAPHYRYPLIATSIAVAVATTFLWARVFNVGKTDVAAIFSTMRWWPIPLLSAFLSLHVALAAWRWSLIEEAVGGEYPRFRRAFHAGAVALGLGTVLPGPLVNILSRSISNRFDGGSLKRGALSGLLDQISDIAIIILFLPTASVAIALNRPIIYIICVPITLSVGLIALRPIQIFCRRAQRLFMKRKLSMLPDLDSAIIRKIYGISVLRLINLTIITLLVSVAANACPPLAVATSIPLVTLAISLAMLPGGFGISEWSFSATFATMGVPHAEIVRFVLANRILLSGAACAVAMMCILTMAFHRRERDTARAT